VNRLRNRLILVFLAATVAPFAVTLWVATSLLERSLDYSTTRQLDEISKALEKTGRELYQRARSDLQNEALAGRLAPLRYSESDRASWPRRVEEFFAAGDPEGFALSGARGDRLEFLLRRGSEVWVYSSPLGIGMEQLTDQYRLARERVDSDRARDLRRGFIYTYLLLAASIWLVSLGLLVFLADRISRPIQELTAGLSRLAAGDLSARVPAGRKDEIGQAMEAFNHMAAQLQQSRERLVYLTQLASWQALARKTAHELKNSLTPIRLTMEEVIARQPEKDRTFLEQAAEIVVEEVESLERRVRAFSDFAAEPPVRPASLDLRRLLEERIAFLKSAHPELSYTLDADGEATNAWADEDLLKGMLTNLLENAAEAAGPGGRILARASALDDKMAIEVHDSGPGVSPQARESLFQPTISFKRHGMGLGLSIARKSALLLGGDILLIEGKLGGAGFRVLLPRWPPSASSSSTTKKTSAARSA
jgi:nitrogen fixation/metabolism regulation signal transduction histidine kinase